MNKNKIFGIFILFALLITCIGVSFASNDFDDSYIDENIIDDDIVDDIDDSYVDDDSDIYNDEDSYVDDEDSDDDSYVDDEDYLDEDSDDDSYVDDEDYLDEDYDDEDGLDDEDWEDYDDEDDLDDEDWEDYDDEDDLDDEDWEDYDGDGLDHWVYETAYEKTGNYTVNRTLYYHYVTSKAFHVCGSAFMPSAPDCPNDNKKTAYKDTASAGNGYNYDDSYLDAYVLPNTGIGQNSVVKSIDIDDLDNKQASDDSGNTSKENVAVQTADANENDYNIFAILALLLVTLIVII